MAFLRKVLMEARVGANILLIDVAKGEARPIVQDLPASTRIGEYEAGLPVKAGFDPAGDKLYYELYGLQQEERANAFMAYDLASGQSKFYAGAEWTNTTLDGRLWPVQGGLMHSIADVRMTGAWGLALRKPDADARWLMPPELRSQGAFYLQLLDVKGDKALVQAVDQKGFHALLQVVDLSNPQDKGLEQLLVIHPDQPPAQRMERRSVAEHIAQPQAMETSLLPTNGVFSPDGSLLLLSELDLSGAQLQQPDLFGGLDTPRSVAARGMVWSGNNRLLIAQEGKYRLYELVTAE